MSRKPTKADKIPSALKSVDVNAILRKRGVFLKLRQNLELKEAALPVAREIIKAQRKGKHTKEIVEVKPPQKYMSFSDEVVATYKAKAIHNAEILEEHFAAAINKFLVNTVMQKAINNLQQTYDSTKAVKKSKVNKAVVFDEDDKDYLRNQATIQLEPYLQNMASIAGQAAYKLIGVDDPFIPSDVFRAHVHANVIKFTQSMIETDQKHLTDIITDGIKDGASVADITRTIKDNFEGEYSKMQAERITRTEVLRSANQSAVDAFKQSGVVEGKQWVIHGADDQCAEYDGEVVTLSGDFYSDHNEFQDGDPPLHPNCKCIVIPVVAESEASS